MPPRFCACRSCASLAACTSSARLRLDLNYPRSDRYNLALAAEYRVARQPMAQNPGQQRRVASYFYSLGNFAGCKDLVDNRRNRNRVNRHQIVETHSDMICNRQTVDRRQFVIDAQIAMIAVEVGKADRRGANQCLQLARPRLDVGFGARAAPRPKAGPTCPRPVLYRRDATRAGRCDARTAWQRAYYLAQAARQ